MSELSLNQFEYDRAVVALRYDSLNLRTLYGKTVFIAGGSEVSFSLAAALLTVNDKKNSGITVALLSDFSEPYNTKFDTLNGRDDFVKLSRSKANEYSDNGGVFIETGFSLPDNITDTAEFKKYISRAISVSEAAKELAVSEVVLLSDSDVYGFNLRNVSVSEKEMTPQNFSVGSLKSVLIQSVENVYASAAHMYGFALKTVRAAKIVSAFTNSDFVSYMINAASNQLDVNAAQTSEPVSYVSLNDLVAAVLFVLCNGENGQVYNACSDNSCMTSAEFAVMLGKYFEKCNINVTADGICSVGCQLDNTRLKKIGWSSKVDCRDALLISAHESAGDNSVFMFADAYDGKLENIQQILLGFLLEVDRICKKHNIKYFLGGGSLLGAVRHKGFIPWDDDADVMMLREDYDRFLSVLPDELPNYLFAQTQENEKDSHFPFTKLRINNTVLSTEFTSRFPNIHNGIFLDVLAQDFTGNNSFLRKIHMHAVAASRWLVLDKWRGTSVNANSKFSSFCANILKTIFPLGFLQRVQNKLISLYKNKKNAQYLFDSMGRNVSRGAFPAKWLDEVIWADFENVKMPIPKEYDKYLTYLYGDYMKMVPVSERHVSHDIKQIDLGEYAGYTCKGTN